MESTSKQDECHALLSRPELNRLSDDNGHSTHSSQEQSKVEDAVATLLEDWKMDHNRFADTTQLKKDEHVYYLIRGLNQLPMGYSSLDASRPWLAYWIMHSLELLGVLHQLPADLIARTIAFLARCQHVQGGFAGGPGQYPHLAPTYAAVNALAILGAAGHPQAYETINRPNLYRFLLSCKQANGAFRVEAGGEVDTRGSYLALAVASLTNLMTPALTRDTGAWLKTCQNWEGGFGGEPGNEAHGGYSFCGFAALVLLGQGHEADVGGLLRWATGRQMALEGGFQGRANKLVDGCYSFWVGALFPLIDFVLKKTEQAPGDSHRWLFDQWSLQKYLLVCCQMPKGGGLRDKPGKWPDFYHTCYCLSGLAVAQNTLNADSPYVMGPDKNKLESNNALFNIGSENVQKALDHFKACPTQAEF